MKRKAILGASLLILSMILVAGLLTNNAPTVTDGGVAANSDHPNASLDAGFDGTKYSSQASPRRTSEIMSGKKEVTPQSILAGGTSTLSIDIPGGWSPIDLSTKVYQLYENRSFTRNPDFSTGYTLGSKNYPNYWANWSFDSSALKAEWNNGSTAQDVYMEMVDGRNLNIGDAARWTQIVYVNGTSLDQAELAFKVKRSPSSLGPGNDGKAFAKVYVNKQEVFSQVYSNLPDVYGQEVIDVTSVVSSLPGNVNVTLSIAFNSHLKLNGFNGYLYYDDVYLYINSTRFPQAVNLTLNGAPVVGQQYGTGIASLHGALTTPFLFASNTTGRVKFICNSTINVRRIGQSDTATLNTFKSPSKTYYNLSKFSFLDSTTKTVGSTMYSGDFLNVSIPHDWTYDNVVFPNGTLITTIPPLIEKYENGSYSWIIMINVTAIGSYRPNPYIVMAESSNYEGSVSTYRSYLGSWLTNDTFTRGNSIKINATVQGQASKGSAYVAFYFASNQTVYLNESSYSITPGSGGVVSFVFTWSSGNVSRSDLWTLVLWSNGTSVAANWALIKFDLDPPQLTINSMTGRVYVSPTGGTFAAGLITLGISAPDAHPKNFTLLVDGAPVKTWNYTTSGSYIWNTTGQAEGNITLTMRGWDQFDQYNITLRYVYVDNSAPNKPTLSYPNDNDVINVYTPTLVWSKASDGLGSGVKSYSLQLDTDALFGSANLRNIPDIATDNYTVPMAETLSAAKWYWHVRAVDNLGNVGDYSVTRSFSISLPRLQLTLPQQSSNIFQSSLTGRYYIRGSITLTISVQDSIFKNVTLLMNDVSVQSWNTPSASYGWNTSGTNGRVDLALSSYNLYGSNNKTLMLTVYVDNAGPQAPSLSYPNDGDTINVRNPQLTWGIASDGEGSGASYYILLLDTTPYFNSTNMRTVESLSGTNYTVPDSLPLSLGTWYWRVYAVDNLGNVGQYSPTRSFQVTSPGLPVALLIGIGSVIPAVAILSSVVLLRRRRKTEAEAFYRRNLIAAYVFSKDGRCIFTHEFKEVNIEPQLLSGFLTAISGMMKEVVGGAGRQLSTIERPDAKILLEFGDNVTGALVAKKSSPEYRRRLKAFLNRFEHDYGEKISKWDGRDIFEDASEIVEEVFAARVKVTTYPTILGIEDLLVEKKIGGVAISVAGKTGSGKSTFCLRHAASLLKRGHPVIIVDGSMSPKNVRKELGTSGVDADKLEEQGLLILYDAYSGVSGIESKEKYKFGSPGELNTINLSLSRNLSKLKSATIFFDSLTAMIEYSDLELAADFIRTVKVKLQEGDHTAFFTIDSNAHNQSTLNYINHVMDGEIESTSRRTRTGGTERLVSFKRLNGYEIRTGYHQIQ